MLYFVLFHSAQTGGERQAVVHGAGQDDSFDLATLAGSEGRRAAAQRG